MPIRISNFAWCLGASCSDRFRLRDMRYFREFLISTAVVTPEPASLALVNTLTDNEEGTTSEGTKFHNVSVYERQ
jgi:hypothetical protein